MKKTIRLTESQLEMVISKTVANIVKEDDSMQNDEPKSGEENKRSSEELLARVIANLNLEKNKKDLLMMAVSAALGDAWSSGFQEGLERMRIKH